MKKWCAALAAAVVIAGMVQAPATSAAPVVPASRITDPKLQAEVAQATAQAHRIEAMGARAAAPTVSREILTSDVDATKRLVRAYGGTVTGDVPGALVQADVPPAAAELIAAGRSVQSLRSPLRAGRLPVPQTIARSRAEAVPGTGPTVGDEVLSIEADRWHLAGHTGVGAKVGIVDYFDFRYWDTAEIGPVPDAAHQFCRDTTPGSTFALCRSANSINSLSGDIHGVAVAEIIKDMAPGAELFVASVGTASDLRAAIDWFAANGVTVISRSLGSAYDGPGDGTGALAKVVDHAASKGIVWFNSAGNDGEGAYVRRSVAATDAAGYVNFATTGSDTWLRVDSQPGGCFFLDGVRWANDWYLPAAQRTDYRVEVYEPAPGFVPGAIGTTRNPASNQVRAVNLNAFVNQGGQGTGRNIIDASQRAGAFPLEAADIAVCPNNAANAVNGSAVTYLRVKRNLATAIGTKADVMEVAIAGNAWIERWVSGGSAAKPVVDSKNRALIAVGALENDFAMMASDTSEGLAYYSSRGPTNDGRVKPDITTLAGVYSATYALYDAVNPPPPPPNVSDPYFHGTSAAAPAVAGAAALVMGAGLSRPGVPLASLMRHYSMDKGAVGPDNLYGVGRSMLFDPPDGGTLDTTPGWYVPLASPVRVASTIAGVGVPAGARAPYSIIDVGVVGQLPFVPITAVAINVTVVNPVLAGHIEVYPYLRAKTGATSTLNVSAPGGVRPNFVVVPVGQGGLISLYALTGGHVLVDVMGYFTTGSATHTSGRFQPLATPERWVNQRVVTSQVDSVVDVPASTAMRSAVDAGEVDALVVNFTTAGATRGGDLKAFETGTTPGTFSNANFAIAVPSTNTAIVPVNDLEQFTMRTNNYPGNTVKVSVDVVGYMTSAAAPDSADGLFVPVEPLRVHREVVPQVAGTRPVSFAGVSASEVLAMSANITVTGPTAPGFLTMWDGATARPGTNNVTFIKGQTVANGALFGTSWDPAANGGLGANTAEAFTDQPALFIIDVNGYFLKAAPPTP